MWGESDANGSLTCWTQPACESERRPPDWTVHELKSSGLFDIRRNHGPVAKLKVAAVHIGLSSEMIGILWGQHRPGLPVVSQAY
jgi:hypothetical protein